MNEKYIKKIHLKNFRGFRDRKIEGLHNGVNIFVGDNDTGKSSVLLAIDLVLGANPNKVENFGLDRLINRAVVKDFLAKERRNFKDLPRMQIDIYLSDQEVPGLQGEHNIAEVEACGMYLLCKPRDDLRNDIIELISLEKPSFPYEYYTIGIKGFGGQSQTPFKKPLQHVYVDNTKISNDYASRSYVQTLFRSKVDDV